MQNLFNVSFNAKVCCVEVISDIYVEEYTVLCIANYIIKGFVVITVLNILVPLKQF